MAAEYIIVQVYSLTLQASIPLGSSILTRLAEFYPGPELLSNAKAYRELYTKQPRHALAQQIRSEQDSEWEEHRYIPLHDARQWRAATVSMRPVINCFGDLLDPFVGKALEVATID